MNYLGFTSFQTFFIWKEKNYILDYLFKINISIDSEFSTIVSSINTSLCILLIIHCFTITFIPLEEHSYSEFFKYLERIINDAENLDYEDYYDLATFEEDNAFCDLIILDGEIGLRYSKYLNEEHSEFENMYFEKFVPDLTSSITLMLGMKQKLNNFIDDEIEYDIQIGI